MAYKYKWKPSASQKREFAQRMQDPTEAAAYAERKAEKRLYDNWKDKDFVPTKDQYDFCFENIGKVKGEQQDAFNQVVYGYGCKEKINHCYIHIVNQLRRKEIEFNNI
jgi:hypothetical protein